MREGIFAEIWHEYEWGRIRERFDSLTKVLIYEDSDNYIEIDLERNDFGISIEVGVDRGLHLWVMKGTKCLEDICINFCDIPDLSDFYKRIDEFIHKHSD